MPRTTMPSVTPWGAMQTKEEIAEGITWCSTPGHGGIWISQERRDEMPPPLRVVRTFAGGNWYEEDEDVMLVILAFPTLFPPESVRAAYRGLKRPCSARLGHLWDGWQGMERAKVRQVAGETELELAGKWEMGGAGTSGDGWRVSFTQVGTLERATRSLTSQEYLDTPTYSDELPGVPV